MVTMCDVSKLYQNLADVSLRLDYRLLILSSLNTNWAKYEIPEDEDNEDDTERTGPDYEYVISTAQGAEAHFKFKYEQEWENEAGLCKNGI